VKLKIEITSFAHIPYAKAICQLIEESARERGIGRGKRQVASIVEKIKTGHGIIALQDGELAGFSYIEAWDNESFVVNTGLIVVAKFRTNGLATKIKTMAMALATTKYPNAKLFSLTTTFAVMKMNSALGYQAVTYSELPKNPQFWEGCKSCPNYKTLQKKNHRMCFCTAMLLLANTDTLLDNSGNYSLNLPIEEVNYLQYI
jgi:hypothetical protein